MQHSRLLALTAVVSVAACFACNDNPDEVFTGPNHPIRPSIPTPSGTSTISGTITVSWIGEDRVVEIHDARGSVYRIVGMQTSALASVDGGDVVARGTFDANPGFVVEDFQVTGMYGRPALDGVLEVTENGFGLRLADGAVREVPGLTAQCAEHLGSRIWVIGWDEYDIRFGLIADL